MALERAAERIDVEPLDVADEDDAVRIAEIDERRAELRLPDLDLRLELEETRDPELGAGRADLALLAPDEDAPRSRVGLDHDLTGPGRARRVAALERVTGDAAQTVAAHAGARAVGVRTEGRDVEEVVAEVRRWDEVRYAAACAGTYDFILEVVVGSNEELYDFLTRRLRATPGVVGSDTSLVNSSTSTFSRS